MCAKINIFYKFYFVFFGLISASEIKYGWITWEGDDAKISVSDSRNDLPDLHVAKATYSNDINQTGWAYLQVHTTANFTDEKQAYAAGFLEGFLTRDLIWMHWQNLLKGYCVNKTDVCALIEDYVDKNEEYISQMVKTLVDDPYWYQVKLYYIQLEGVTVGYNQAAGDNVYQRLTNRDIMWINMLGDLDELAMALATPAVAPEDLLFPDHCTGLVKLLPDLSNLYTAHVTWNSYQSMLRIQKMYVMYLRQFPGSNDLIPGYKMSMSSYPGMVQSTDDFVLTSAGLVAAETTTGNSNRSLFAHVKPVGQLLEFVRSMVALRLARDGREWTDTFRKHNSGTYNNQWYIVDYNKFTPRSKVSAGEARPGLLWVLEQLPGYTEAADLTHLLVSESYFPSYNIPYFERVFNLSGGNERVAAYGDWFGYRTNPRAKILLKKQAEVVDLASMYTTMRYNDYKHDPLSRCDRCRPPYSACNAIAARNDLNPPDGYYPFRALGHRSHGATDAKVTSATLRPQLRFVAVSSPPHNISRGIPPFDSCRGPALWRADGTISKLSKPQSLNLINFEAFTVQTCQKFWNHFDMGPYISHLGHPDVWAFPPVLHSWDWN